MAPTLSSANSNSYWNSIIVDSDADDAGCTARTEARRYGHMDVFRTLLWGYLDVFRPLLGHQAITPVPVPFETAKGTSILAWLDFVCVSSLQSSYFSFACLLKQVNLLVKKVRISCWAPCWGATPNVTRSWNVLVVEKSRNRKSPWWERSVRQMSSKVTNARLVVTSCTRHSSANTLLQLQQRAWVPSWCKVEASG